MLLFIKVDFNPTGNIVTEQVYIRRIIWLSSNVLLL